MVRGTNQTAVGIVAGIEGGSSSSSCGTARQSLVRFQKRKHVITLCSFSSFQTPAGTPNINRKAWTSARIYGIKHTHTHQCTQLTIVTNIVERELVETFILSYGLKLVSFVLYGIVELSVNIYFQLQHILSTHSRTTTPPSPQWGH